MAYQYVREPLLAEEADELANACETTEEKLIVWTLLDTGLRVSELCALTPKNIQWQQRSIRVKGKGGPFGGGGPKGRGKQRVVPMSPRVRTLLEAWFTLHDSFPVGTRMVLKVVKRVANRARISREVTPHVLRHTCATLMIQKGVSLAAIQKVLGHERLSTTAIYLNLTDAHVVSEYEQKW